MRRTALLLLPTVLLAQGRGPAPVEVAPVVAKEAAAGQLFVGTIEPVRRSVVGSELDGLVVEYLVDEGQRVAKGQPLAKLRTRLIEIRLQAARALHDQRRHELDELVNGSRKEDIDEAKARVDQAEAEIVLREWKLASAQRLLDRGAGTEDERTEARAAIDRAKAGKAAVVAAYERIKAGPRKERIAQARARLATQKAEVDRLEDELQRHVIRAPFAGFVVGEHTEIGQWLAKGEPVAEIVDLASVDVTVPVLEDYIRWIKPGTRVSVTVDAVVDRIFEGTIRAVVPTASRRARTFPVRIRVANANALLKDGMFARVALAVGEKQRALFVPKDAIVLPGPLVYKVSGGVAQPVRVVLGIAVDGAIAVRGKLAEGDSVVVRGNERLFPGMSVAVKK